MKRSIFILVLFAVGFISCKSDSGSSAPEVKEAEKLDSLTQELDDTQKSLEETGKELDDLLNDIE